MSKFIPDPQIQSLRAMRAGDIAFAVGTPTIQEIGVAPFAALSPEAAQAVALAAVETLEPLSGTPSESAGIGVATATTLSEDAAQSVNLGTTNALEALSGMPSEAPVIGVATGTSVV